MLTIHHNEQNHQYLFFFFQAEDGIRDLTVTGVQTCALPISIARHAHPESRLVMRRIVAACCLCCLVGPRVHAQDGPEHRAKITAGKVPVPPYHFQPEYTFDAPGDPQRWSAQPKGLNVSFASTDPSYFRSEVPDLPQPSEVWKATGWKGERLNTELVVWSPDTVSQIRAAVSDLVDDKGNVLAGGNVHV